MNREMSADQKTGVWISVCLAIAFVVLMVSVTVMHAKGSSNSIKEFTAAVEAGLHQVENQDLEGWHWVK